MRAPKACDVLPNGATVVDTKMLNYPGEHHWYVLCVQRKSGYSHEYVTWEFDPDTQGCDAGHYFCDLLPAVQDFNQRGVHLPHGYIPRDVPHGYTGAINPKREQT